MWKARIKVPDTVAPNEIFEVKTLIAHPMESGFRRDNVGRAIPRDILTHFDVRVDDTTVFAAELFPAITANPYLTFTLRLQHTSTLVFRWRDQDGQEANESRTVVVT